jgi:hypothetical protein
MGRTGGHTSAPLNPKVAQFARMHADILNRGIIMTSMRSEGQEKGKQERRVSLHEEITVHSAFAC